MHESEKESEVAQSSPTLSDPMDCSPPGSSVRGIFQARVLAWGAIVTESYDSSKVETLTSQVGEDYSEKEYTHTHMTKVRLVKAMAFPLVMYGCERWTIKKAERLMP